MKNLSQKLQSIAINGKLSLEEVLAIVSPVDQERTETKELLQRCEKQVGLTLGEDINIHLAKMDGTSFNSMEYNYERLPGDQ